ncbi:MAG: class I SAM-dependent methyltransferase, partial [Phenylobacterium sp.]
GGNPDNVDFICGDAQRYGFSEGSFDAIFSRFGVMFFDDATGAFRNLLCALHPGGRLGFVCWRDLSENELDDLPLRAAASLLPPDLVSRTASSGWFSFSRPESLRRILVEAGFVDIQIASRDLGVHCGSLRETVDVCTRVGAVGAIVRDRPHLMREAALALEDALRERDGPDGPQLRAGVWIVTAGAP